jgi:5-methylcytosine-specific restriction protein A
LTGFPQRVLDQLQLRSNGRCERCGVPCAVFQAHHRRPRGMGGSTAADTNVASNALLVCVTCHADIEANRSDGLRYGWLVRQGCDPGTVPVLRRGEWVLLGDKGEYTATPYQAVTETRDVGSTNWQV